MTLTALKALAEGGDGLALVTILQVKGSSPRHPGSKLLADAAGLRLGTVGGGRGEARALDTCRRCLEQGAPAVFTVEMLGTDIVGADMVCGGSNTMLVEPRPDPEPYRRALARLARGERVLLVKRVIAAGATGQPGAQVAVALLDQTGAPIWGLPGPSDPERTAKALATGQPGFDEASGTFYDPLFPEEKLLILGGGHVGQALAALAPSLGFRVTVVDDRLEFIGQDRFPGQVRTLQSGFAEAIAAFPFDAATYAVVVTRGHLCDLECVRALLAKEWRYAGFMGSARKTRFVIDQVRKEGYDPAKVDALWAPIGLDLAAETPQELAVAILGELVAVRRNAKTLDGMKAARESRRVKP